MDKLHCCCFCLIFLWKREILSAFQEDGRVQYSTVQYSTVPSSSRASIGKRDFSRVGYMLLGTFLHFHQIFLSVSFLILCILLQVHQRLLRNVVLLLEAGTWPTYSSRIPALLQMKQAARRKSFNYPPLSSEWMKKKKRGSKYFGWLEFVADKRI